MDLFQKLYREKINNSRIGPSNSEIKEYLRKKTLALEKRELSDLRVS